MEKESVNTMMGQSMMETGLMDCTAERVFSQCQMVINTLETGRMGRGMEKESSQCLMEMSLSALLQTIARMEWAQLLIEKVKLNKCFSSMIWNKRNPNRFLTAISEPL